MGRTLSTTIVEVEIQGLESPIKLKMGEDVGVLRAEECHVRITYLEDEQLVFVHPEMLSITFKKKADTTKENQSLFQLIKERGINSIRVRRNTEDIIYRLNTLDSTTNIKVVCNDWTDGGLIYTFSWAK